MINKNIALFGLGPHARKIYYPLIEQYTKKYNLHLKLIVDLKSQEKVVMDYLYQRKIQPEKILFIDEKYRNGDAIDGRLLYSLNQLINDGIDGIIIATEARSHKMYIEWAISNNIDILLDKPIFASDIIRDSDSSSRNIINNYIEIKNRLMNSSSNIIVVTQRRVHNGYVFALEYLSSFVNQYQVPITYIDIYHADGVWSLPNEYTKENHPYKYGYGKLMHSGYHFIDLFSWIMQTNKNIASKYPDIINMFATQTGPGDMLKIIDRSSYSKLFPSIQFEEIDHKYKSNMIDMGEVDVFILLQSIKDNAIITTSTINLLQNSFSRRAWTSMPLDSYQGNGRVRHERVNIQIASLLNLQIHSYQATKASETDILDGDLGHKDHFDVYIFRNSGIIGGKTVEKVSFSKHLSEYQLNGHNEQAKERLFLDFLYKKRSASNFFDHELTNQLLSRIYECLIRQRQSVIPYISFNLKEY